MWKDTLLYLIIYILSGLNVWAEDITHFQIYTTADGLSHRVIHTIIQDSKGYIWMATWNGLCRYDGCDFRTYNKLGDGQLIGRINRIAETEDGEILCLTSQNECYLFNPVSLTFVLTSRIPLKKSGEEPYSVIALKNGIEISNLKDTFFLPIRTKRNLQTTLHAYCTDRNGNLWVNCDDVLYKVSFPKERYRYYTHIQDSDSPIYGAEIRSILYTGKEVWMADKNGKIYIYDVHRNFIGYLSARGNVVKEETSFGANVYSMMYRNGKIWIASKGNGLFMLTADIAGKYQIFQWKDFEGDKEIYTFTFDSAENLWVGTYNKGIYRITSKQNYSSAPLRVDMVGGIRHIRLIHGHFIVASKKGLLIYDSEGRLKQRMGNQDYSYIHKAKNGDIYIATMGFGLYKLTIEEGKWRLLPFKALSISTETILSIVEDTNGELYFIRDDSFFKLLDNNQVQIFGDNYFGQNITFTEAEPFIYNHTLWVGTAEGYMTIDLQIPDKSNPPFYWKEIRVDTLCMQTDVDEVDIVDGQELRITPIVLDYGYKGKIQYKYRIDSASEWTSLNEREAILLRKLKIGKHLLEVRYTDSRGVWTKEAAVLTIHVKLPFRKSMLYAGIAIIIVLLVSIAYYFKKKRDSSVMSEDRMKGEMESEDTRLLSEADKYIRQNIANEKLTVDRLGEYLGVSRSVLYQRMKDCIDKTPAQLIKDIRIEEAERLLQSQKYTITEVADMTGFCDAKYFSKVFKKETGKAPTAYLKEQNLSRTGY